MVRNALSTVVALLLGGCGPRAPAIATAPPAPAPKAAAPLPARWLRTGGATLIGSAVEGGTLVLVSGRRAVVARDGSVREEAVPSPEPLSNVVAVPTAAGSLLVAVSHSAVYRLDDPLGKPRVLATFRYDRAPLRIGAGPGTVAVWSSGSVTPRFLDVESGQTVTGPDGGVFRAIAFRSMTEGAALVSPRNLVVTSDRGATWRSVTRTGLERIAGVEARDGVLCAVAAPPERSADPWEGEMGPRPLGVQGPPERADIDVGAATLGPLTERSLPRDAPGLLRWIERTGDDPRAVAVEHGVLLREGEALLATSSPVWKVDLDTGAVREVAEAPGAPARTACWPARSGKIVWLGCPRPGTTSPHYDGKRALDVFALEGEATPLAVRGPVERLDLNPWQHWSAARSGSGGVAFFGACRGEAAGSACVLQPDGAFRTVTPPADTGQYTWGALADGRLAYVSHQALHKGTNLVLVGPGGRREDLPPIRLPDDVAEGQLELVSASLDEGLDHTLRFLVMAPSSGSTVPRIVAQPLDGRPAEIRPIPGALSASLHAGHGLAFGTDAAASISTDSGATWTAIAAPALPWAQTHQVRAVNEIGALIDGYVRIGWGPQAPIVEPDRLDREHPIDGPYPPPAPGERPY